MQLEHHVIIKLTTHPFPFSLDATCGDQVSNPVLCKRSKLSGLLCHFLNTLKSESFIDIQGATQALSLGWSWREAGVEASRHKFL